MGNLGAYQTITTIAKKVGGPKVLTVITCIGGYFIIRPVEAGVKWIVKRVRTKINSNSTHTIQKQKIFTVASAGKDSSGLEFHVSDKYRVLERDKDAVLIEKFGDDNNPYFVSCDFLKSLSDFDMA